MMKLFVFASLALSSIVIASGITKNLANAQSSTKFVELGRQTLLASASMPKSIYIAQANTNNSIDSLEQAVYNQINDYRTSHGLSSLTLDPRISQQARNHSQDMASGQVPFGHDGFAQRIQAIAQVIPLNAAAENVAYNQGYSDPVTQAVQGWLNSPGHLTNIQGQYNLTGIGVAKSASGAYYFTQIFVRSS